MSRDKTLCLIFVNIPQTKFKMLNYQNFAVKLVISLAIFLINFWVISPANATTQELQINSDQGYIVKATFSYDAEDQVKAIAEKGKGVTKAIKDLKVSFYDPAGSMVASYDNIVDGVAQENYFEFHYDPDKQELLGELDIGGESEGEMYLKGNVNQELSLIMIKPSGEEEIIDRLPPISY